MGAEDAAQVFAYVDDHFDAFVEDLTEYCRVPTISARGEAFREGARATRRLLERYGVRAREMAVPSGPRMVVGEVGTGARSLCLYNHYDVQPVDPLDEWEMDPFDPVVRDGRLYARGVADTKGNTAAQALAQAAVREVRGAVPLRLRFMVEGEEEIASPHLLSFWKRHKALFEADGATIEAAGHAADGSPQIQMGSKGILYVELRARTARIDQHSSVAVSIPNPAWHLVDALRTLRDPEGRITLPGLAELAPAPSEEALAYLEKNRFDPLDWKETYGAVAIYGGDDRVSRLRHMVYGNTCNIDGIVSGYTGEGSKTVNPATARVKLDLRLLPGQRPDVVLDLLRTHLKEEGFGDVEVEKLGAFEPASTPVTSPLAEAFLGSIRTVYDSEPNVFPWSLGSSSTWYYTEAGTPAGATVGVGYAGSQVHAPNEHIRLEDARRAIKALAALFLGFAG